MSNDAGSGDQSGQHFGQLGSDFASTNIMGTDMENISWSTFFAGLKVNTGIRFVVVFSTFICWLYVVYWVRHHEPFANQAVGISAPHSATTAADRSLIARVIKVFPFQTSAIGASSFYAPSPAEKISPRQLNFRTGTYNESFGQATQEKAYTTGWVLTPGSTKASPLIGPSEQKFDQRFGSPVLP